MAASRPVLARGSWGPDVKIVQTCLLVVPVDSDFGPVTEDAVRKFQRDCDLDADGVVGPDTWAALEKDHVLPPYPPPLLPPLTAEQRTQIYHIVNTSDAIDYSWKDRGTSPSGYVHGMAFGFVTVLRKHQLNYSAAVEMAEANTWDPDYDALSWYADIFANRQMDNSLPGLDTLRHLWTLLYGLGMRESSGQHCCGRDMSADNVSADTAEAGLFQMSWNARTSSPQMQRLFDEYSQDKAFEQGGEKLFKENVTCSSSDWECYGSGPGFYYQRLAKVSPQFACETAAIGLRNLRQHWGPINRKEAEVRPEVNDMLLEIQEYIAPINMV
jgi:Putative peptidoglycan binding domain